MKETHKKHIDNRWDNRELGASEKHARKLSRKDENAVDEKLNLSVISIRLQKELINNLKFLAKHEGIGYQPFIRQILTHYARDHLQAHKVKYQKARGDN